MRTDEEIWFPSKRFGWGWGLPRVWQGWAVIVAYAVMLGIGLAGIDPERQAWLFTGWMIGWTLAFVVVCWLKGERPAWRWGRRR